MTLHSSREPNLIRMPSTLSSGLSSAILCSRFDLTKTSTMHYAIVATFLEMGSFARLLAENDLAQTLVTRLDIARVQRAGESPTYCERSKVSTSHPLG